MGREVWLSYGVKQVEQMKKNHVFKLDTLSKICDRTAYLSFPHLSMAGSPALGAVAKWITHSQSRAL